MNQDKRLWKMICLITALSVFFVVIIETRPSRFSRPLIKKGDIHVLTERKHIPDLNFFWDMGQKVSRYNRDLSDEQNAQMKEEFWKMFVRAVALQEDAALQKKTWGSAQDVEHIFPGYLRAIDNIFTPEQQNRNHNHHSRPKRPGRRYAVEKFWALTLTSGAPVDTKSVRSDSLSTEDTTDVTQQYAWATLARVSMHTPLDRDLSQLQILRL